MNTKHFGFDLFFEVRPSSIAGGIVARWGRR